MDSQTPLPATSLSRLRPLTRFWPVTVLAAFLAWGWQAMSLSRSLAYYGDTMEFMWVLSWYGEAFRTGQSIVSYPLAFFPAGWYYAENLLMLVALLPLVWLGGPAFAYNLAVFLSFIAAFAGSYLLARRFVAPLPATVVAILVAFWGFRWFQHIGHINILIGSALVPWVLLALDRALRSPNGRVRLLVAAGVLWAAAMSGSMYFAYIIGIALIAWTSGYLSTRSITWRTALLALALPTVVAVTLSLPGILWLWRYSAETGVSFYSLGEVNFWSASLNSLPIPSIDHVWLGSFARSLYRGIPYEQGATNYGLLVAVLAVVGFGVGLRQKKWRPVLFLAIAGLVLSLGMTLKWNNESLQWDGLRPLNAILWQVNQALKPAFFPEAQPPAPFDAAVPLPGMLFAAIVPFVERARVFARFAFTASFGVFLLAALGLTSFRNRWLRLGLAALVLVEVIPAPLQPAPFPPEPHPVFVWLTQQSMPQESIADLVAGHPFTPVLLNEGDAVWATRVHGKPTVAGASSIWPAHTMFLFQWLATHEHAFWSPDLAPLLRFFRTRYILLHMRGEWEQGILAEAEQNQEIKLIKCFDPPQDHGPWSYPICVLEVLPPANPNLNLVPKEGWSGAEAWGVWAEGTTAKAYWVATAERAHTLQVEAFPMCVDGQPQTMQLEVNGQMVASHPWTGCETWKQDVVIPASLVHLGANELVIKSDYAASPNDVTKGQNPDTRQLSAGFTKLRVDQQGD